MVGVGRVVVAGRRWIPVSTERDVLGGFEVGYDRDYVGVHLHCRLCSSDRFESGHVLDLDIDEMKLSDVVAKALEHAEVFHSGESCPAPAGATVWHCDVHGCWHRRSSA